MGRDPFCWLMRVAALILPVFASDARAQPADYPSQRVTIIVGFAAGGAVDVVARVIAERLQERWNVPVVVENRVGASGNIAAATLAKAAPDGHTLLSTATGIAVNQTLYQNPGYSIADFIPISFVAINSSVLAIHPSHPARTLREFLDAQSGKSFSYGTAGVGSAAFITAEYFFKVLARVEAIHTPYQSGAQAVTGLLGQHIDLISVALPDAVNQIRQGSLRALAVTDAVRSEWVPNVPTFAESGFPDFVARGWSAMFVAAKTSPQIADKINAAVAEIMQRPDVKQRLNAVGFSPSAQSLDAAAQFLAVELERWGRMVKAIGLTVR